jgi:RNA-directed DNA polymerase
MKEFALEEPAIAKLNIPSPAVLADRLGISLRRLAEAASRAPSFYSPFDLAARSRPFQKEPSQKVRHIDCPTGELKAIQRQIDRVLLHPILFPPHIFGGVRSRSILDNASFHLGTSLLITIDIRSCFPTISNLQIYRTWTSTLGCSARVGALLTKLTTFERRLPQGAPTSPSLANLFIWSIDAPIRAECARIGIRYSTWVDDLAFSGTRAREIIELAVRVLAQEHLAVSRSKIKIMGPRAAKLLTGTRLGQDKVRAPHDLTSRVRAAIHKVGSGQSLPGSEEAYLKSVRSQVKHIERLCPDDVRLLSVDGLDRLETGDEKSGHRRDVPTAIGQ